MPDKKSRNLVRNTSEMLTRKPLPALAILCIITAFMALGLIKLETKNNREADLPSDNPIVVTDKKFKSIFGDIDIVMIGLETDDIYTVKNIKRIADLSEQLKTVDSVISNEIFSLTTINNIERVGEDLKIGPNIEKLPASGEEIAEIKRRSQSNDLINGRIVSTDGTFTLITANLEEGYDQNQVYTQVKKLTGAYEKDFKVYLAGDAIQQQEIDLGIQQDVSKLMPLALILVLLGYFFTFRTALGVLLPFGVVVLSITWTMGLMGHLGLPITVVSSALPMLMIAISSSYGIHILQRYYEQPQAYSNRVAATNATQAIFGAIVLTALTTALGSATLLVFKVTSIKEFGLITALGVLSTLVITLLLIPPCLSLLKRRKNHLTEDKLNASWVRYCAIVAFNYKKTTLLITAVLLAITVTGLFKIRVGADFVEYFPDDHSIPVAFDKYNTKLDGARYMDVMIDGINPDAVKDPVLMRKIFNYQKELEKLNGVGSTYSLANVIARIGEQMADNFDPQNPIPEKRDELAQYLLLYTMSGDPGDLNELVDYGFQNLKIRIMLTTSEQTVHTATYERAKQIAQSIFGPQVKVEYGGETLYWLAYIDYIVLGKIQNIILAIVAVLLFCTIVYRSFSAGIITIVPLLISTIMTYGLMGHLGIRLEMGTAIITAIGIGIGVDFAIHFYSRLKEELVVNSDFEMATKNTYRTAGRAIVFDVISNLMGFGVFVFSGFTSIQAFGWLISFMMISVAFASLVLLPALISVFKPKYLFQHADPAVDYVMEREQARRVVEATS